MAALYAAFFMKDALGIDPYLAIPVLVPMRSSLPATRSSVS